MTAAIETKPPRTRAAALAAMAIVRCAALLATACAGTAPPLMLYQLRALPLSAAAARAPAAPAFTGTLLIGPIDVPEYLNRSTIVTRRGAAGLALQDGHRWAEPLPEAFARVLAQNLAARLGPERVWTLPLPASVRPTRQLRIEVQRFDADEGERSVVLAARWALFDPRVDAGAAAVHVGEWRAEATGAGVDALVAAHSAVLARFAEALAASLAGAPPQSRVNRPTIRDTRASG